MIDTGHKYQGENPLDYQYTLQKKRKDRRVKQVFPGSGYQREGAWHKKVKKRVNVVDVFCIHM
jgi:hypothetical protein